MPKAQIRGANELGFTAFNIFPDAEAGITAALKFPNAWRSKFRPRMLECTDFTLAVIPVGESPGLKITDEAARELLEKRKAAKEEAQPRRSVSSLF